MTDPFSSRVEASVSTSQTTFQAEGTADTEALSRAEEETQACVFQELGKQCLELLSEVLVEADELRERWGGNTAVDLLSLQEGLWFLL